MKRKKPTARDPFIRGFLLGRVYEQGASVTTELIRRTTGASKPMAKRDLISIERVVPVTRQKRGLPSYARRPDARITIKPMDLWGRIARASVGDVDRAVIVDLERQQPKP